MSSESIFEPLWQKLGDKVSITDEDRVLYSYDATGLSSLPSAVTWPTTENDIREILIFAHKSGIPVIPRGAGTSVTGGPIPVNGGIVLCFSRMNRILDINPATQTAIVEPGLINGIFKKKVQGLGLFYPPDPSSLDISTLGGNVATCAGGPNAIKYGVTRDYVLGLTCLLPDGRAIKTGVQTSKGVAGYDLTRLLTGSEGTLAVITQITLKLISQPETSRNIQGSFSDINMASEAVTKIMSSGILPNILELMDETSINSVKNIMGTHVPTKCTAILLAEIDGDKSDVKKKSEHIALFMKKCGAIEVNIAATKGEVTELWRARRSISPAVYKLFPFKISEDIVVPRDKIPLMILKLKEIGLKTGLTILSYGHAGDGNLHVNIGYHDTKDKNNVEHALRLIFSAALNLGGTISGEHGIGLSKKRFLTMEIGRTELDLMRDIKNIFDPNNMLNPDKIFPEDL